MIREELDGEGRPRPSGSRRSSSSESKLWGVVKDELERGRRRARHAAPHQDRRRRPRRSSSTPTRSSSTRTRTSSSRATAGSSACASSRIRPRRAPARATRSIARAARLDQGEGHLLHRTAARRTSSRSTTSPRPTGYGDPAQKHFKFDDGERIVVGDVARSARDGAADAARGDHATATACASRSRRTPRSRPRPAGATPSRGEGDEVIGVVGVQRRATSSSPRRATATCCTARPTRSRSSRARAAASP